MSSILDISQRHIKCFVSKIQLIIPTDNLSLLRGPMVRYSKQDNIQKTPSNNHQTNQGLKKNVVFIVQDGGVTARSLLKQDSGTRYL
jgi:hypothetical protein